MLLPLQDTLGIGILNKCFELNKIKIILFVTLRLVLKVWIARHTFVVMLELRGGEL